MYVARTFRCTVSVTVHNLNPRVLIQIIIIGEAFYAIPVLFIVKLLFNMHAVMM